MDTENKKAFTLMEVLITLALILILAAVFLGGAKRLRIGAQRQLTQSAIEIISTAVGKYYDRWSAFPFEADVTFGRADYTIVPTLPDPKSVVGGTTREKILIPASTNYESNASSAALFYYLDKDKDCRQIVETLTESLITSKDAQTGAVLLINIGQTTGPVDLPRFIDAWGVSFRYEYGPGYPFPVITSAGQDKVFGTADDLKSQ